MILMIANHISSMCVVILCWWLAHQYSRDKPPGRMIAAGFACVGFSVLVTAVVRGTDAFPTREIAPWMLVVTKVAVTFTFGAISIRRNETNRIMYGKSK